MASRPLRWGRSSAATGMRCTAWSVDGGWTVGPCVPARSGWPGGIPRSRPSSSRWSTALRCTTAPRTSCPEVVRGAAGTAASAGNSGSPRCPTGRTGVLGVLRARDAGLWTGREPVPPPQRPSPTSHPTSSPSSRSISAGPIVTCTPLRAARTIGSSGDAARDTPGRPRPGSASSTGHSARPAWPACGPADWSTRWRPSSRRRRGSRSRWEHVVDVPIGGRRRTSTSTWPGALLRRGPDVPWHDAVRSQTEQHPSVPVDVPALRAPVDHHSARTAPQAGRRL